MNARLQAEQGAGVARLWAEPSLGIHAYRYISNHYVENLYYHSVITKRVRKFVPVLGTINIINKIVNIFSCQASHFDQYSSNISYSLNIKLNGFNMVDHKFSNRLHLESKLV